MDRFSGALHGSVRTQSGQNPLPGTCVPGDAAMVVDGPRQRHVAFVTVGEACRLSDDSATAYVGWFDLWDSTPHRLDDIQGMIDIRLLDDGRAVVSAVEAG